MKTTSKTLRFAVVAVLIAAIFAIGGANLKDIIVQVWKFATETDKGYMWITNIAIGAVIAALVSQLKVKGAKALATVIFIIAVIVSECLLWHRAEMATLLLTGIQNKDAWIYIGLGVVSSIIAYILVERESSDNKNDNNK